MPEMERTRGAALAEKLSVPVLGRTWQMLLKGVQEVEAAPDRRAAADMVLIRLCFVADLPPPAELIRTLSGGAASSAAPPAPPSGPRVGPHPVRGEMLARAEAAPGPDAPPAAPLPEDFPAAIALAEEAQEPVLAAELRQHAHLVRYAPPVIEIRPEPTAPRDLAQRLARTLRAATGVRWTIALSTSAGAPTLAAAEAAADAARRAAARRHPLVAAILAAFPGAEVGTVRAIGAATPGPEGTDAADETAAGDATEPEQSEEDPS